MDSEGSKYPTIHVLAGKLDDLEVKLKLLGDGAVFNQTVLQNLEQLPQKMQIMVKSKLTCVAQLALVKFRTLRTTDPARKTVEAIGSLFDPQHATKNVSPTELLQFKKRMESQQFLEAHSIYLTAIKNQLRQEDDVNVPEILMGLKLAHRDYATAALKCVWYPCSNVDSERSFSKYSLVVEVALSGIHLSGEKVVKIGEVFRSEVEKGIHEQPSSLQMENTYIPELPDGTEEGLYLALDLGGTNFRMILLELEHGKLIREEVKHYHIGEDMRIGCGEKLFDYLAECVSDFVKEQNLTGTTLPLGFTFSFPMIQKALDIGILVTWTKSFNCPSVVGRDAVQMLRESIHRRGDTHVEVVAVLNDTTGTLVQGAVLDSRTAIGLILGTGSNACYLERADKVQHWEVQRHGEKQVIIDIEWGAFGDNGALDFVKTDYDRQVDQNSLIKNSFTFEKYISGKYMGEIVRVILQKLVKDGVVFNGDASEKLLTSGAFTTSYVSLIEQDTVDGVGNNTKDILDKLGLTSDEDDIEIVKYICEVVSNRAALLVSVCLAVLLKRMDRPDVTIAVDGSLFKHHPRLKTWMNKYIKLLAPGKKFRLLLAEDGSGKGAGLVAAIALKLKKRFQET